MDGSQDPNETWVTWAEAYDRSPKRDVETTTMSGVPVEPVYGPVDARGGDLPGQFPYTRGPYASMYRSKVWTMRMFAGFGTPVETNGRFRSYYISTGVMTWSEEKAKVFETQEEAHQAIEDMNREYDRVIRLYSEDASRIPEGAKFGGTKA